jgi:hypothetical protein
MNMRPKTKKLNRYSISVTGQTYDRLRATVKSASLQKFVNGILVSALDDPTIAARVTEKCRSRELG